MFDITNRNDPNYMAENFFVKILYKIIILFLCLNNTDEQCKG